MRRTVERQIMEVVDKANLPLNIKLAWYGSVSNAVTYLCQLAG